MGSGGEAIEPPGLRPNRFIRLPFSVWARAIKRSANLTPASEVPASTSVRSSSTWPCSPSSTARQEAADSSPASARARSSSTWRCSLSSSQPVLAHAFQNYVGDDWSVHQLDPVPQPGLPVDRNPGPSSDPSAGSAEPRWFEGTKLVHDVGGVVGRPLLADAAVGDPVDIDCVPSNLAATGGYAQ